jgi:hypothetical protein
MAEAMASEPDPAFIQKWQQRPRCECGCADAEPGSVVGWCVHCDHVYLKYGPEIEARHFAHLQADLALANIHLEVLLNLLEIPEFLEKKWYIFSGLQGTEMARFTDRLRAAPLKVLETWSENLWFTVLAKRV